VSEAGGQLGADTVASANFDPPVFFALVICLLLVGMFDKHKPKRKSRYL